MPRCRECYSYSGVYVNSPDDATHSTAKACRARRGSGARAGPVPARARRRRDRTSAREVRRAGGLALPGSALASVQSLNASSLLLASLGSTPGADINGVRDEVGTGQVSGAGRTAVAWRAAWIASAVTWRQATRAQPASRTAPRRNGAWMGGAVEQRAGAAQQEREHHQRPDGDGAGEYRRRQAGDQRGAEHVGAPHQPPPVVPVRDRAGDQPVKAPAQPYPGPRGTAGHHRSSILDGSLWRQSNDLRAVADDVVLRLGGNESGQVCSLGQQRVAVHAAQLRERLDAQCLVPDLPGALPQAVDEEGTGGRAVARRERHRAVVEDQPGAVLVGQQQVVVFGQEPRRGGHVFRRAGRVG